MTRVLWVVCVSLLVLCLTPGVSAAQLYASEIPDCITVAPPLPGGPEFEYVVRAVDLVFGPVPGATVLLEFYPDAIPLLAWCGGVPTPTLTEITDPNGFATFKIHASGCVVTPSCALAAAVVSISHPTYGFHYEVLYCINSPDVVGDPGGYPSSCPPRSTCPSGNTGVGLSDAVYFTPPISLGLVDPCTDFAPPYGGPIDVSDAVVLTPYIILGSFCPCL
jgi:hypothetical protein